MFATNTKGPIRIVHDTPAVIWNTIRQATGTLVVIVPFILLDVIPQNGDIVVPVWPTLFMIESKGMKKFMGNSAVTSTTTSQPETLV